MMELEDLLQSDILRGLFGESGSSIPTYPIMLGYPIWAYHNKTGILAHEIMKDGKKHAAAQLYVAKEYNLPFVVTYSDLNIIGEALGATLTYMPDVIPVHEIPAVITADEIEALETTDPRIDGRMPQIIETCKIFARKLERTNYILVGGVEGPITAAGSIWGMENLMRNMIKNPDLVHKVLEISTDSIIEFLNAQMEQGVDLIAIGDPSASCTCISPKFFQEFAVPNLKKIVRKVNSPAFMIHICGETFQILKFLTRIRKILAISVDIVDMKKAKEEFGKKFIVLMGNASTEIMRYGTPQQVEQEAKRCIQDAGGGGKFLLSTSCDLAPKTPPDNIRAFLNAGKKYGTFPLEF
ncbi:MAG: uroporphyrinogen decarboxylase family protein [Candidatus Thorarchaeota archaeon]